MIEFEPSDEDDDGETPPWGVPVDDDGRLRVLSAKCATCIYRRGNLMWLEDGRKDEMAATAVERGSWIISHSTLPYNRDADGNAPEVPPAVCRGYYDAERRSDGEHLATGIQLAERLGMVSFVDPPATGKDA